jgi:hypothetical protein
MHHSQRVSVHCSATWHCMALHGTAWHCTALHGTAWHCMALHGTAWHCTALHGFTDKNKKILIFFLWIINLLCSHYSLYK